MRSGKLRLLHFIVLGHYITLPCLLPSKKSGGRCIVLHFCSETTSSAGAVVRLSSSFTQCLTKRGPDAWEGLWSTKRHSYYLSSGYISLEALQESASLTSFGIRK